MPQSAGLGLARAAAETPAVERGTWFDTCPGRGAKFEKGRWRYCRAALPFSSASVVSASAWKEGEVHPTAQPAVKAMRLWRSHRDSFEMMKRGKGYPSGSTRSWPLRPGWKIWGPMAG